MSSSWRKFEDENGFSYYVNEATNAKQWDHPKFSDVQQKLDECNWIKYSTYRVASKFRVLQRCLYMEDVSLSVIAGVFERHKLGSNESSLYLESYDIEAILSDIYFAANKQNQTNMDIDLATELMLNFLYNIYDKNRKDNIQVLSTKLVLAVLSNTKLHNLYHFIFNLCADHNNCVTRLKVQMILSKLAEITTYLHEDSSFGHHLVNTSIEDCFSKSPGLVGINEGMFISWLETNPLLLAWIPTLHRLKNSEMVVHAGKCSVCKASPIIGMKYRCGKCGRYTQCQKCYLTGRTSHSHKVTHPMREYCVEGESREITHAVVKKLCGLLRCTAQVHDSHVIETKPLSVDKDWLLKSQSESVICDIEPMSSPHIQLQVIIRHLEQQNRELQQMLLLGTQSEKDMKRYLEEHRLHVAAQISKLKILKEYLKKPSPAVLSRKFLLQSTPMVSTYKNQYANIDMFSPIVQKSEYSVPDECNDAVLSRTKTAINSCCESTMAPSINDISTWLGGKPSSDAAQFLSDGHKSPMCEMHNDLDEALAKLQQILANNFTLDESLGNIDNGQLKEAVSEVEGMLTSLIDTVENSRASSAQLKHQETDLLDNRCKYT